uniref:AP-1 complex subunit gamma n=1 Tax=Physcomitrium patens TaxID=3218 RepID=A0A2K1JQ28_PHYPA|nr:hypothetical protein PHYPA_016002 [Physcomitrium patens]
MAFIAGNRLRDMINSIRACKTAAEERTVVTKECAALRDLLKEPVQYHRHRNIAKLIFIHMMGYPTHFGQMECIKLIAEGDFPEKRIGYLGLMVLLDERQEVLMLVTNSIKKYPIPIHAESMLGFPVSIAALCAVRIVRKVPDLIESYKGPALNLLMGKHHGVLVAGVKLCFELCQASAAALEHFRKQVSTIVGVLKSLVLSGYASEYDVTGISDPLLQIKLLKLLRLVGRGDNESSDVMSDVLAQVATNTEGTKNAGKAILYECVLTIMAIEDIGGLRVLAINILGRFLANMDNNIRYVALNTLVKVVAVDNQAVQRHRATIVNCIKDSDISIRARALELVCSLVNESNVEALTTELLEYLKFCDPEFKVDLATKTAALVHKFAPTKLWYIDQIIMIMLEAGKYVKNEVVWHFVVVVSNAIDLRGYAVRTLYRSFHKWTGQESLAQVTVWCIGEYGDMLVNNLSELEGEDPQTVTESDAVDVIENVLRDPGVNSTTIAFCLMALLKLSSRFPHCTERVESLLQEYHTSIDLELQQRSFEFGSIVSSHSNLKVSLTERMPILDFASYSSKRTGYDKRYGSHSVSPTGKIPPSDVAAIKFTTNDLMDMLTIQPIEEASALPASAGDAPYDIVGGSRSSTSAVTNPIPARLSIEGASALLNILAADEEVESSNLKKLASSTTSQRTSVNREDFRKSPINSRIDHRMSILELEPHYLRKSPLEEEILSTNKQIASLVEPTLSPDRSSSLALKLLERISITTSRDSILGRKSSSSSQRSPRAITVDPGLTLAEQKRFSINEARLQRISSNDARLQSSQGSHTEPLTSQQRKVPILGVTEPTLQRQEGFVPEDAPTTTSRISTHTEPTPTQLQRSFFLDESPAASSRISPRDNQLSKVLLEHRTSLLGDFPSAKDEVVGVEPISTLNSTFGGDFYRPAKLDQPEAEVYPSILALQTQGLKVNYEFTKSPESPKTTVIKAIFTNTSTTPYTDFLFQAAVPKFMTLRLDPASGSSLPQNSSGVITQILTVTNSLHGQKPLVMRVKIAYKADGQPVLEQGEVNNFPSKL